MIRVRIKYLQEARKSTEFLLDMSHQSDTTGLNIRIMIKLLAKPSGKSYTLISKVEIATT